jgi:DNA-directed RNA polymerase subunit beta
MISNKNSKLKSNNKAYIRKNNDFKIMKASKIDFISISNNQMISTGTSLIPFVEHDDANRALMGSNMQKQAVPLVHKEIPKIQTGLERTIGKNSEYTTIAKTSGLTKYSSNKKTIIYDNLKFRGEMLLNTEKDVQEKIKIKISKNKIKLKFLNYNKKTYKIETLKKSNQNTQIAQIKLIQKGEWVKKGQILCDSNGIKNGTLAIGKNLLLGYICWEGYNFEDAIVISERIVDENVLTSLHIKKYKTFIVKKGNEDVRMNFLA